MAALVRLARQSELAEGGKLVKVRGAPPAAAVSSCPIPALLRVSASDPHSGNGSRGLRRRHDTR